MKPILDFLTRSRHERLTLLNAQLEAKEQLLAEATRAADQARLKDDIRWLKINIWLLEHGSPLPL